jgi:hypothetical protein
VIVPVEEKLHWQMVRISFGIPEHNLDLALLSSRIENPSPRSWSAVVGGDESLASYSYVWISPISRIASPMVDHDLEDGGEYLVQITTFRARDSEDQPPAYDLSHTEFLELLHRSIHNFDQLKVVAITELYYPAERASWRMKLLADPPELGDFQSDIGVITLSGLKLRFSNSAAGLLEASLDTTPDKDEYHCALTSTVDLRVDSLAALFPVVLEQAEEFASLFIELKEGSR